MEVRAHPNERRIHRCSAILILSPLCARRSAASASPALCRSFLSQAATSCTGKCTAQTESESLQLSRARAPRHAANSAARRGPESEALHSVGQSMRVRACDARPWQRMHRAASAPGRSVDDAEGNHIVVEVLSGSVFVHNNTGLRPSPCAPFPVVVHTRSRDSGADARRKGHVGPTASAEGHLHGVDGLVRAVGVMSDCGC